jgi:hypothetical protein
VIASALATEALVRGVVASALATDGPVGSGIASALVTEALVRGVVASALATDGPVGGGIASALVTDAPVRGPPLPCPTGIVPSLGGAGWPESIDPLTAEIDLARDKLPSQDRLVKGKRQAATGGIALFLLACHSPQLWQPPELPRSAIARDCSASHDLFEPGQVVVYAYGLGRCPACDRLVPELKKLAKTPGVTVRIVDIQDCAGRVADANLGERYPTFEVIGPDGRVVRHVNPYHYENAWNPDPRTCGLLPESSEDACLRGYSEK